MPAETEALDAVLETRAQLLALVPAANVGDANALHEIDRLCAEVPDVVDHLASLRYHAERSLIATALNTHGPADASVALFQRQQARFRGRLKADGDGSVLDGLIADQVAADALAVQVATIQLARGGTAEQIALRSRQLDHAHRRYVRSLRLLHTARSKLAGAVDPDAAFVAAVEAAEKD